MPKLIYDDLETDPGQRGFVRKNFFSSVFVIALIFGLFFGAIGGLARLKESSKRSIFEKLGLKIPRGNYT